MEKKHLIFLSQSELREFLSREESNYEVYKIEIYPRGAYYDLYGSNDCRKWILLKERSRFKFELFKDIFKYDESVF